MRVGIVQPVTHPKNWYRVSNDRQETNRHVVRAARDGKSWNFIAERKAHELYEAKTLGAFTTAAQARAVCEADYETLPQYPRATVDICGDVLLAETRKAAAAKALAAPKPKARKNRKRVA